MPRTRAQRLRDTMNKDGWADLPDELVEKVLEQLGKVNRRLGVSLRPPVRLVAGMRCVEGRARCAGAETADHRRGRGHASAAVPGGGVGGQEYAVTAQ
jgi:hypothetical protein